MVSQELLNYIHQQTQLGKNRDEITKSLIAGGWKAEDVEQAFNSIASGVPAPMASGQMPSASQIFKEAWEIYKARFKTLIAIILAPVLPGLLVAIIVGAYILTKSSQIASSTQSVIFIVLGILFVIAIIGIIYVAIWSQVAQLIVVRDQAEGIGWKEAFKRSKGKLLAFFLTSLLVGLATIGGLILLIIPGIIFAFWFSQSIYIVVEENLKGPAALKRSKYYVKGRIGQVFTKGFYIAIVTFAIYIIVGVVIYGLNSLVGEYFSWLSNVFSFVWGPMTTVYAYLVYKHLKATRP